MRLCSVSRTEEVTINEVPTFGNFRLQHPWMVLTFVDVFICTDFQPLCGCCRATKMRKKSVQNVDEKRKRYELHGMLRSIFVTENEKSIIET